MTQNDSSRIWGSALGFRILGPPPLVVHGKREDACAFVVLCTTKGTRSVTTRGGCACRITSSRPAAQRAQGPRVVGHISTAVPFQCASRCLRVCVQDRRDACAHLECVHCLPLAAALAEAQGSPALHEAQALQVQRARPRALVHLPQGAHVLRQRAAGHLRVGRRHQQWWVGVRAEQRSLCLGGDAPGT